MKVVNASGPVFADGANMTSPNGHPLPICPGCGAANYAGLEDCNRCLLGVALGHAICEPVFRLGAAIMLMSRARRGGSHFVSLAEREG